LSRWGSIKVAKTVGTTVFQDGGGALVDGGESYVLLQLWGGGGDEGKVRHPRI
jgi:hypothetical protein